MAISFLLFFLFLEYSLRLVQYDVKNKDVIAIVPHAIVQKILRGFGHIKKYSSKKVFAYDQFNVDVHFLLFFSSSKNDVTNNLKKACETGIYDPFITIFDLIIPKQQKPQKSVYGVVQGQNI